MREAARLLDASALTLDPERGFVDQGLDSMLGLQLRARLNAELGAALPPAAIFVHPTPERLARAIVERHAERGAGDGGPPATPPPQLARTVVTAAGDTPPTWRNMSPDQTNARIDHPATPASQPGPAPAALDAIAESFERNGFFGPIKVYEPEEARELLRQIRIDNLDRSRAVFDNDVNYDRHFDIPALTRHVGHPRIVEVVRRLLGPDLLCWRSEFFPKFPGGAGTEWHQVVDYAYATGRPMLESSLGEHAGPLDLTVWTAFTDATRANGCMKFLPGSHKHRYYDERKSVAKGRAGEYRSAEAKTAFFGYEFEDFKIDPNWSPDESAAAAMEMRAGECVIFSASCVHASYPNTTERQTRFAITSRYAPAHVRVYPGWTGFHAHGGTFDLAKYGCVLVSGRDAYGHNRLRTTNAHGEPFPYVGA